MFLQNTVKCDKYIQTVNTGIKIAISLWFQELLFCYKKKLISSITMRLNDLQWHSSFTPIYFYILWSKLMYLIAINSYPQLKVSHDVEWWFVNWCLVVEINFLYDVASRTIVIKYSIWCEQGIIMSHYFMWSSTLMCEWNLPYSSFEGVRQLLLRTILRNTSRTVHCQCKSKYSLKVINNAQLCCRNMPIPNLLRFEDDIQVHKKILNFNICIIYTTQTYYRDLCHVVLRQVYIIPQHANWRRDRSIVVMLWGRAQQQLVCD